jgi:hypothetical protein
MNMAGRPGPEVSSGTERPRLRQLPRRQLHLLRLQLPLRRLPQQLHLLQLQLLLRRQLQPRRQRRHLRLQAARQLHRGRRPLPDPTQLRGPAQRLHRGRDE